MVKYMLFTESNGMMFTKINKEREDKSQRKLCRGGWVLSVLQLPHLSETITGP